MPNRPDNPYERFPLKAAFGLLFMLSGAVALLFLSSTWRDWRQAALGAIVLLAVIGLAVLLRRFKIRRFAIRRAKTRPSPQTLTPEIVPSFDPASFIEATKRRHAPSSLRQIEDNVRESRVAEATPQARIGSQTTRRLQDLRDHPATPGPERKTADDMLKKQRSKRRSAWRKGP